MFKAIKLALGGIVMAALIASGATAQQSEIQKRSAAR
jgi:hypothetical protein